MTKREFRFVSGVICRAQCGRVHPGYDVSPVPVRPMGPGQAVGNTYEENQWNAKNST